MGRLLPELTWSWVGPNQERPAPLHNRELAPRRNRERPARPH